MPAALRGQLVSFLSAAPITAARVREALQLVLSSTHFMWY